MEISHAVRDERPWDQRMLERISRDADKTQRKVRGNPYTLALHLPVVWAAAIDRGAEVWLLAAIIMTAIPAALLLRARSKRARVERQSGTAQLSDPFGS
jgi:hypothetical protein